MTLVSSSTALSVSQSVSPSTYQMDQKLECCLDMVFCCRKGFCHLFFSSSSSSRLLLGRNSVGDAVGKSEKNPRSQDSAVNAF